MLQSVAPTLPQFHLQEKKKKQNGEIKHCKLAIMVFILLHVLYNGNSENISVTTVIINKCQVMYPLINKSVHYSIRISRALADNLLTPS